MPLVTMGYILTASGDLTKLLLEKEEVAKNKGSTVIDGGGFRQ